MEDWNDKLLEEETEVHAKWLQGFLRKFKKPEISPSWTFRDTMKRKLNKKIKEKKEAQERVVLASIPSFAKWRFRFTGFVSAICAFVFIFILSFFTDFFSYNTIFISKKYTKVESLALPETLSEETSQMEKERVFSQGVRAEIVAFEQVNSIEEEESYLYDGKHYPKVAKAMPVYKYTGILGNEETLTKQLKSLKF
ncbi:MAG: hypothetical protein LBG59_07190 [Candidatus Peribacteria bacterium]|jgi:hypothetical protein|nr:hypothetical protein [Candidatus Peribacteria bacterium]